MFGRCPLCDRGGLYLTQNGFCSPCDVSFGHDVKRLFGALSTYLANHRAFADWLDAQEDAQEGVAPPCST